MLDKRLLFIGYMSFYENADFIKKTYKCMPDDKKYVYKYYVYAQRYLSEKTCNLIWTFLNSDDELEECLKQELFKEQFKTRRK